MSTRATAHRLEGALRQAHTPRSDIGAHCPDPSSALWAHCVCGSEQDSCTTGARAAVPSSGRGMLALTLSTRRGQRHTGQGSRHTRAIPRAGTLGTLLLPVAQSCCQSVIRSARSALLVLLSQHTVCKVSSVPQSSDAATMSRRAMKSGSSPDSIIRTSQYKAASGLDPRIDFYS